MGELVGEGLHQNLDDLPHYSTGRAIAAVLLVVFTNDYGVDFRVGCFLA